MKPEKPKLLFAISALVFSLFLISCALLFYFTGKGAFGGALKAEPISFSLTLDATGEVVLSEKIAKSVPEGEDILLLKNEENETITFTLYQEGEVLHRTTLSPYEGTEIEVESKGGAFSILLKREGKDFAYLSDEKSFSAASAEMKEGGDLTCLAPLNLNGRTLSAPFRLFGDFSFEELSIETHREGRIALCPDASFSAELYVSASKCDVYFDSFSLSCEKGEWDYFLKAKSLNGKVLSPLSYPVSSYEKLSRLADEALLPNLCDGAKISFSKSFSVEESLNFSALASLTFSAPVDFGGYALTFSSEQAGEYWVKTTLGASVDASSLVFLSPLSTLVWEGEGAIPASSNIAKIHNVKSYNGAPLSLGGEGSGIPQLSLLASDNDFLEEDVFFQTKGNLLTAVLPYLVSQSSLDSANFSLSCDGGTVALEGTLSSGVIKTVDSDGKERRFAVSVEREAQKIPVVHLETEGGAEITSKSQYISATFAMDGGVSEYDSVKETHIRIRGRGNSSWKWEKKPYKIHFDEPTSILGLPAAEEWALFSNYADKSLMRNRLAQVMASTLSFEYCPTQVCVDVFLNGEYLGVYTLGEHLEAGEGRVEVEQDMSQADCGYFLEAGGVVSGVDVKGMNYFHADLVKFVLIKSPDYNTLTSEQFDYIRDYMLAANEAVKKGEGYEEYLDMQSVVDWMIMTELTCNTDCSWRRSTYFTKDPGGKLVMGPVWDFDLAFGNFSKDNPGDDTWVSTEPEDDYVGETWSTYLLQDPEFQALFKKRWQEVSQTLIDTALRDIEEQYELLSPSAELNFKRWDILGRKVAFERHDTTKYKTYSSQIYYLQNFLINRAAWIDAQIENW